MFMPRFYCTLTAVDKMFYEQNISTHISQKKASNCGIPQNMFKIRSKNRNYSCTSLCCMSYIHYCMNQSYFRILFKLFTYTCGAFNAGDGVDVGSFKESEQFFQGNWSFYKLIVFAVIPIQTLKPTMNYLYSRVVSANLVQPVRLC